MSYTGGQVILRRTRGEVTAEVRRGKKGQLIVRTENSFLIPLAIIEVLVMILLVALMYCLRFDPTIRFNSDMVDYSKVLITCDRNRLKFELSRPYFDYVNPDDINMSGLELQYELPEWAFFLCALLLPISIICIVEGLRAWFPGKKRKEVVSQGKMIPQFVRRILRFICAYIVGGCLIGIFISIFKFNITSPRPHFMTVCFNSTADFPNSCTADNFFWNPHDDCNPDVDQKLIVEALKSFPSYHAAVALYCGSYISAYVAIAAKLRSFYSGSLLVLLTLGVMTMMGATHRLGTGHSFPIDVIIGSILGALFGFFVINITMNKFKERRWKIKKVDPVPHKEDNMLPIKELSHIPNYSVKQQPELISTKSFDSAMSSSDIDTDEDYEEIVTKLSHNMQKIPRINANNKQPEQAVNLNVKSAFTNGLLSVSESMSSRFSSYQNRNSQLTILQNNQHNRISRELMNQPSMNTNSFRYENRSGQETSPVKPRPQFSYNNEAFEETSPL